jgi:hypothetical protein
MTILLVLACLAALVALDITPQRTQESRNVLVVDLSDRLSRPER